ncbi:RRQRL motif-containing zinc-binding protein [Nocardiopsis sp. MG754419]|uniref:RRQRL motif-containing zinc-binding protein n=1 Tax=Nocardiopsis sp. MG754419 TaxID=2259865 RepID=UPI001BAD431C|nr:RRQRL motif-containing zinc-binding protein [Nocardiopsis sp. MG754419]
MPPAPTRFLDLDGSRFGIPTYPWGWSKHFDPDLGTKAQLRAQGLSIAGLEVAAQLMWASTRSPRRDRVRTANLYRPSLARPVRPMTPAQERALSRAHLARHTCSECGRVWDVYLPTSNGRQCPPPAGCRSFEAPEREFGRSVAVAA